MRNTDSFNKTEFGQILALKKLIYIHIGGSSYVYWNM